MNELRPQPEASELPDRRVNPRDPALVADRLPGPSRFEEGARIEGLPFGGGQGPKDAPQGLPAQQALGVAPAANPIPTSVHLQSIPGVLAPRGEQGRGPAPNLRANGPGKQGRDLAAPSPALLPFGKLRELDGGFDHHLGQTVLLSSFVGLHGDTPGSTRAPEISQGPGPPTSQRPAVGLVPHKRHRPFGCSAMLEHVGPSVLAQAGFGEKEAGRTADQRGPFGTVAQLPEQGLGIGVLPGGDEKERLLQPKGPGRNVFEFGQGAALPGTDRDMKREQLRAATARPDGPGPTKPPRRGPKLSSVCRSRPEDQRELRLLSPAVAGGDGQSRMEQGIAGGLDGANQPASVGNNPLHELPLRRLVPKEVLARVLEHAPGIGGPAPGNRFRQHFQIGDVQSGHRASKRKLKRVARGDAPSIGARIL